MAGLRNKHADMEIWYVNIGTQKKLYVQVGHERQIVKSLGKETTHDTLHKSHP